MKRFVVFAVLLALAGCATAPENADEGIARSNGNFEVAFNAHDAAAVAALYAKDAAVLAPNLTRIDGRAAIQGLWQQFFDAGIQSIDLTTIELSVAGQDASEVGSFALVGPDGKGGTATIHGKYIVLWQLGADGVWRLRRDIWNTDPAG